LGVLPLFVAQKLPRKAKVALGCLQYKTLLKTPEVAQKSLNNKTRRDTLAASLATYGGMALGCYARGATPPITSIYRHVVVHNRHPVA
jgi:predicted aconitase